MFRPKSLSQTSYLVIGLVFTLGLVLRLGWMVYSQPIPVSDFEEYHSLAKGLLEHGQVGYPKPSALRLPVYPAFLAIMMAINKSTVWLSFCNVVLSALLIIMVYYITRKFTLGNRTAAYISGLACALNPTFICFSPILASEHLFAVLLFCSILLLNYGKINLLSRSVLSGLTLGMTVLTRGEAVFYLPVLAIAVHLLSAKRRYALISSVSFALAWFAVITPWYLRNSIVVGADVGLSTTSGINFYHGHNENSYGWHSPVGTAFEGLDEVAAQKLGYKLGWDYLKEDPKRLLSDIARGTKGLYFPHRFNYAILWSMMSPKRFQAIMSDTDCDIWPILSKLWFVRVLAFLVYGGLLLTALVSVFFYKEYSAQMCVTLLGIILMNWVCYAVVFWGKERYRFTTDVVFCILSGAAIAKLIDFTLTRLHRSRT